MRYENQGLCVLFPEEAETERKAQEQALAQQKAAREAERKAEIARQREEIAKVVAIEITDDTLSEYIAELVKGVLDRERRRSLWKRLAVRIRTQQAREQAKREAVQIFLDLAGSEVTPPRVSFKEQVRSLMGPAGRGPAMLGTRNRDAELARANDEVHLLCVRIQDLSDLIGALVFSLPDWSKKPCSRLT